MDICASISQWRSKTHFNATKLLLHGERIYSISMSQVSSLKHVKPLKDIMYVTFILCDRSLKVYTHLRPSAQCYINLITSLWIWSDLFWLSNTSCNVAKEMKTVVLGAQVTVLLACALGLFLEKQKYAILHRSFY